MSHQSNKSLKILYYIVLTAVVYLTIGAAGFAIAFVPTQHFWLSLLIGGMAACVVALFTALGHVIAHLKALHRSYKRHLQELHMPVDMQGELSNLFAGLAKAEEEARKAEEKVASSEE